MGAIVLAFTVLLALRTSAAWAAMASNSGMRQAPDDLALEWRAVQAVLPAGVARPPGRRTSLRRQWIGHEQLHHEPEYRGLAALQPSGLRPDCADARHAVTSVRDEQGTLCVPLRRTARHAEHWLFPVLGVRPDTCGLCTRRRPMHDDTHLSRATQWPCTGHIQG